MTTTVFPFITRYMKVFILVSMLLLVPGVISLMRFGVRPSIDFTGGTQLELAVTEPGTYAKEVLEPFLSDAQELTSIQPAGDKNIVLRLSPIDSKEKQAFLEKIKTLDPQVQETRFETLGPVLGRELIVKTAYATAIAIVLIALYLGIRFSSFQYGVCAALATIHDGLVVLGVFSLLGYFFAVEVDVLFVTALLTIISFSVHDTIVVYDRIRERIQKKTNATFEEIVNSAALETLNRSLRNSLAVIFMLLIVFLLTEGALRWFIFALLIGTITGTYSSTCVALPLLVVWERFKKKKYPLK